ncbi:MAG TPA: hypothetical protein VH082_10105 [Rudaea sp.]|jgi:hypothetical protein|nr:hypothetical protein [Rudaea sp.]
MSVLESRRVRASLLGALLSVGSFCRIGDTQAAPPQPMRDDSASAQHQFDFLIGDWKITNHRLKARLAHSSEWIDFEATDSFHALPGGLGTEENFRTEHWPQYNAIGLHLFDPSEKKWFLYWADNKNSPGVMQTLATGFFSDGVGTFYGTDTVDGQPVIVRIIWKRIDADHARWEQAFSIDDRKSWETNWTMDFVRTSSTVN